MVGYNINPSQDNSSKKMRSNKTLEPEPESLDRQLITDDDATPPGEYNDFNSYAPANLKDAKLVGYSSQQANTKQPFQNPPSI
jgi:hypothetical protein